MSEDQMAEAYTKLMAAGAEEFGIHSFLASNTVTDDYYPKLAGILFELAVRCTSAPAQKSSLSTCPAAWASPTALTSAATISLPLARACAKV